MLQLKQNEENINQYLNGKRIVPGWFASSICGGRMNYFYCSAICRFSYFFSSFPISSGFPALFRASITRGRFSGLLN